MSDAGRKGDSFPRDTTLKDTNLLNYIDTSYSETAEQNRGIILSDALSSNVGLVGGKIDLKDLANSPAGTYANPGSISVDTKGRVTAIQQGTGTSGIKNVSVGTGLSSSISIDGLTLNLSLQKPGAFNYLWPATSKGDIVTFDGTNVSILSLSPSLGYVLTVDNTSPTGFAWKAPTGGSGGAVTSVTGTGAIIASPTTGAVALSLDTDTFNLISPKLSSGTTQKGALIANTSTNISTNTFVALAPPSSPNQFLKYTGTGVTGLVWDIPAGGGTLTSVNVPAGQGLEITGTATDPIIGFKTANPVEALNYIAPKLTTGTSQRGALIANKSTSLATNDFVAVSPPGSTGLVLTSITPDASNPHGLGWTAIAPSGDGITGITQGAGILVETTNPAIPTVSLNPATAFPLISPLISRGDLIVSNSDTGLRGDRFPLPTDVSKTYKLQTSPSLRNTPFGMGWVEDAGGGDSGTVKVNGNTVNNPDFQTDSTDSLGIAFKVQGSAIKTELNDPIKAIQPLLGGLIPSALLQNTPLVQAFNASLSTGGTINTTYNVSSDVMTITFFNVPDNIAAIITGNINQPSFFGGANQSNLVLAQWFFLVSSWTVVNGTVSNTKILTITGNPNPDDVKGFINYNSTSFNANTYSNNTLDPYRNIFTYSSNPRFYPSYDGERWNASSLDANYVYFNPPSGGVWPITVKTLSDAVNFILASKFSINVVNFTNIGVNNWTVPSYITRIYVTASAGGGSGAANGAGGGGGGYTYKQEIFVTPGETLNITVGYGGTRSNGIAEDGGTTQVLSDTAELLILYGGKAGKTRAEGGTGGAAGNFWASKGTDFINTIDFFPGGGNPLSAAANTTGYNTEQIDGGYGAGGTGKSDSDPSDGRPGIVIIEY